MRVLASGEVGTLSYRNAVEAVTATSYRLPPKAFYRLEGGNGAKLQRVVNLGWGGCQVARSFPALSYSV